MIRTLAGRSLVPAIFLGILLGPVNAWAVDGLDLSLSSETASLSFQLSPYNSYRPGGGLEVSVGFLTNEIGDNIGSATILAKGVRQSEQGQYKIGAGFKLVGGKLDNEVAVDESVGALALGFQASVLMSPSEFNPIDLIVEGFYAPSISSFSDAESFTEVGARLQIDVIPQARAYIGYRRVLWDTNDYDNVTVDRALHIGLSLTF